MIGGRELLANLAIVEHLKDTRRDIGKDIVLKGVLHLVGTPHFLSLSLRVLHFLQVVVLHVALHKGAQVTGLQRLLTC